MVNNTYIFLRHAETEKDPSAPASEWGLTKEGLASAAKLAQDKNFVGVDLIFSSKEKKSDLTALPFSKANNKPVIQDGKLNEIKRGDKFLSRKEFAQFKKATLTNLGYVDDGGKCSLQALERIKGFIVELEENYSDKKILIVSHGTILSLLFAELSDKLDEVYDRWQKLKFCAWGKIENGKIVKDLI